MPQTLKKGWPVGHPFFIFGASVVKQLKKLPLGLVVTAALGAWCAAAQAQERIFRCGNEYTNSVQAAQRNDCKPIEGGSLTIVQPPKVLPAGGNTAARAGAAGKVDSVEQRTRDAEVRQILEAELRKAETRRDELLKAYNQGEPEKEGKESRNYQKYLDRVAEMKANLARAESDIAGLRRELGRLSVASSSNVR